MSNKAVVDGVIQYVSVSQIQTFDVSAFGGCPRKWWFDKIAGLPAPTTKAQAVGVEVHKQIENYLNTGEDTLGPIARAGKHFLPTPMVHLLVEHAFTPTSLDVAGIPLKGFIDVVNESGQYKDNEGRTHYEDIIEVIDHKTTVDFKYAKSASELRDSVQMVGYAEFVRRRDVAGVSQVRISHNNFLTRGAPAARKVTTTIEVPQILEKWERVSQTVNAMKVVAKAERVEDVEANYEACSAYRGCPYMSACPRAKDAVLSFVESKGEGMSLLNRFMKQPTPEHVLNMPVPGAVALTPGLSPETDKAVAVVNQKVNPPDAVVDPKKAAEPLPPEVLVTMSPEIQAAAAAFQPSTPMTLAVGLPVPAPTEAPKKRGRKPGSKNAPKVSTEQEVVNEVIANAPVRDVTNWSDLVVKSEDVKVSVAEVIVDCIELYVDCSVSGIYAQSLDGYITEKCRALETKFGAADLRCAPMDSPLAYNKWKGALAALVRNEPPPVDKYTLDDVRESEIKQVVVEALRPLCGVFVRGR